jgi:hypothetical protein
MHAEGSYGMSRLIGQSPGHRAAVVRGLIIVKSKTVVGWHRAGFPPVLALAITAAGRPTQGDRGDSDSHPSQGD